jgi:type II secretory pathway pseudopilin PulG
MWPLSGHCRHSCVRRRRQGGFTLFETILVIGMLALVSAAIAGMQPRVFATQTTSRDEVVGVDLMRACAERLLAVRRNIGYTSVTNTLCNGLGGVGGFASNPTVTLTDAASATITTCSSATCTATIIIAKSAAPAAALTPITLRLSAY